MTKNCIVINIPGNGETEHKNYCAGMGAVLAEQGIGYKVFPVQNFQESDHSPNAGAADAIKAGSNTKSHK